MMYKMGFFYGLFRVHIDEFGYVGGVLFFALSLLFWHAMKNVAMSVEDIMNAEVRL